MPQAIERRVRRALTRGGEEELRSARSVCRVRLRVRAVRILRAEQHTHRRGLSLCLRAPERPSGGKTNADQAAVHDGRQVALREDPVPPRHVGDQEPGRLRRLQARGLRRARALEPGCRRHPRPEVFPQGRRARRASSAWRRRRCPRGCGARLPMRARSPSVPRATATSARPTPARCSTGSPAPGPTGAGRAATSPSEDDARAFFDEHRYMLAMQYGAPNSPQWFNTGLHWAYGIDGPSQGHYYVDHETGELTASTSAYEHPAAARLLHPVDRGRPRRRERHHGPVGARGAPLQVRLRHRLQLLQAALREREALGRRQVVGPR